MSAYQPRSLKAFRKDLNFKSNEEKAFKQYKQQLLDVKLKLIPNLKQACLRCTGKLAKETETSNIKKTFKELFSIFYVGKG